MFCYLILHGSVFSKLAGKYQIQCFSVVGLVGVNVTVSSAPSLIYQAEAAVGSGCDLEVLWKHGFAAVVVFYSACQWMRKASHVVCIWCVCGRKMLGAADIYDFHSLSESQRLASNIIWGYEVLVILNSNSLNIWISSCLLEVCVL